MQLGTDLLGAEDDEMHLHVGCRDRRTGAEKSAGIARADGQQALAEQDVAQAPDKTLPPAVDDVVHGDRLGAAILEAHLEMILQIRADAGMIGNDGDAVLAQKLRGADAGELQNLRRVDRAGGEDHLARRMRDAHFAPDPIFDAFRTMTIEKNPRRQRAGFDLQIGMLPCLLQKAGRGRRAPAIAGGELEIAGAFLVRAVEIVVAREAGLHRRLDERFAERMRLAHIRDVERPAGAVQIVGAVLLVLRAPEVRQHILEAPAGIAELAPVIEVFALAAHIKKPVDRARSAEHLSARLDDAAVVQFRLRLGLVKPVHPRVGEQFSVTERDVDPGVAVAPARFQQQHAIASGLREPMRQHAARATRPDDDVIETVPGHAVSIAGRYMGNARRRSLAVLLRLFEFVEL